MLLLEIELAIYQRLTGAPLDPQGRPLLDADGVPVNRASIGRLGRPVDRTWDEVNGVFIPVDTRVPSYGVRMPLTASPTALNTRGLTSRDPAAVRLHQGFNPSGFRQVPVFDTNLQGRKHTDVYPSVTFKWLNVEPGDYYVYHDPYSALDTTSPPVTLTGRGGEVVAEGYTDRTQRPNTEQWSVSFAIVAWAKHPTELMLISQEIMSLFPQKDALCVELQDGTITAFDMLFDRDETRDTGGDDVFSTFSAEEARPMAHAFIYKIDGSMDNSTNQYGVQSSVWAARTGPVITQLLETIYDAQSGLVETGERDVVLDLNSESS